MKENYEEMPARLVKANLHSSRIGTKLAWGLKGEELEKVNTGFGSYGQCLDAPGLYAENNKKETDKEISANETGLKQITVFTVDDSLPNEIVAEVQTFCQNSLCTGYDSYCEWISKIHADSYPEIARYLTPNGIKECLIHYIWE